MNGVSLDLHESRVLITGASGGIGASICQGFLDSNAQVYAVDIKSSALSNKLAENNPNTYTFHQADLAQPDDVLQLISLAENWNINTLINNAAIFDMAPFIESDTEQYQRLFNINVQAMFQLMQGICRYLVDTQQKGKIINFSSQAGRRGEALVSHYCASKAAVISYTQSAALAFAKNGININAIAPGVIDTPMWKEVDAKFAKYENRPLGEKKKLVGEQVPMGYMGQPNDVVGAVLFFSSSMSDYITGQTLNVDGGNVLS